MSGTEHAVQSYLLLATGDRIPTTHTVDEFHDELQGADAQDAGYITATLANDRVAPDMISTPPLERYGVAGDRIIVFVRHVAAIVHPHPGRSPR